MTLSSKNSEVESDGVKFVMAQPDKHKNIYVIIISIYLNLFKFIQSYQKKR